MRFLTALFLISFFAYKSVYGGDLPESILVHPNADVFLGKVVDISDGKITIEVIKSLLERYDAFNITLEEFSYMTADNDYKHPQIDDYCAIAAEYADDSWRIVYEGEGQGLAVKSDSLEPETLTLFHGGNAFAERMNQYINDGTYSKENLSVQSVNADEKSKDDTDADLSMGIIQSTPIVVSPPVISAEGEGLINRLLKYTVITLLATFISYCISKKIQGVPIWHKDKEK